MKFVEAVKLAKEGDKLVLSCSAPGFYLQIKDGKLCDHHGIAHDSYKGLSYDDWEVLRDEKEVFSNDEVTKTNEFSNDDSSEFKRKFNFGEALKLLRTGVKVTREAWISAKNGVVTIESFLTINETANGQFNIVMGNSKGSYVNMIFLPKKDLLADDWIVCKANHFEDVFDSLMAGKRIAKLSWDEEAWLQLSEDGTTIKFYDTEDADGLPSTYEWDITSNDLLNDFWEVLD